MKALILALCLIVVALPAGAQQSQASRIASDMVAKAGSGQRWSSYVPSILTGRIDLSGRIVARPFAGSDTPLVDPKLMEQLGEDVLAELAMATGGRLEVISNKGVRERARLAREQSANDGGERALRALAVEVGAVLELVPAVGRDGDHPAVRYQIQSVSDGRILVQSEKTSLGGAIGFSGAPLGLDAATHALAQKVIGTLPADSVLFDGGIRLENTGTAPKLGMLLKDKFFAALDEENQARFGGRHFVLRPLEALPSQQAKAASGGLTAALPGKQDNEFVFSGRYWQKSPGVIELILTIEGRQMRPGSWPQGILVSSLPSGIQAETQGIHPDLREDMSGPFGLVITSNHGKDPIYQIGDRLQFSLKVDRPAEVHCWQADEKGAVGRLFPNIHHPGASLTSGKLITLPDDLKPLNQPEGSRIVWTAEPPTGPVVVKCFALELAEARQLPKAVTAEGDIGWASPGLDVRNLLAAYRGVSQGRISEASMVTNVVEKRAR